jgi:hypothetical protein
MKFNIVTFTVLLAIAIGVNAKGGGAGGGHGSSGGGHGSSGHASSGHASSGHASTAKATPASKSTTVSEPVRVAPPVVSSGSNKGSDSDCKKEKKC